MGADLGTIVTGVLSAGGVAFLGAVVKGIRDLKAGARSTRGDVITSQRQWITDLETRLARAETDRDFWQDVAGRRGHELRSAGRPVERVEPPSQKQAGVVRRLPKGRPQEKREEGY